MGGLGDLSALVLLLLLLLLLLLELLLALLEECGEADFLSSPRSRLRGVVTRDGV